MRTLLITGGAGFIGSNFVKHWYENHPGDHIVVLDNLTYSGRVNNIPPHILQDNKRFEFCLGNVCSIELVNNLVKKADIVVHFAAESHVTRSILDSRIFFETDVFGTHTLCNAILKSCESVERLIHISTSEVYGSAITVPMNEDHPLNPCSPYASAKCGADRLVYSFFKTYGLPCTILRPFNQYGPYQHLEKAIPRFIVSTIKDEPLTVHGDGTARRDWLYVEDTCRRIEAAIMAPIEKVKGEVFNLGSGSSYSILEIAEMILSLMHKPKSLITHVGDRLGQVEHHLSSTEKAENILGISPGRSFEEGLKQTIKWYQNNEAWWSEIEWMKHVKVLTKSGLEEYH